MKQLTAEFIGNFQIHLLKEEKAPNTLEKYIRDIKAFATWIGNKEVNKIAVLDYKQKLMEHYAPASVNSILSALNSFFSYMQWLDCKVKTIKMQKQIFLSAEKELTKAEYIRLLSASKIKKNQRLYMLMQTICCTGIRVSELRFITVAAIRDGKAAINCKGKMRIVMLPKPLCKMLKNYVREKRIKCGSIFVSKNGIPLDRSNIWSEMKKLCKSAGVSKEKVFPHNLRHLFARTYYSLQKDIIRLSDILGHTNINTTRIYTMESGEVHRQQIEKLGLLQC